MSKETIGFYACVEMGRTIMPKYKTIYVGTKVRIKGTDELVTITKVDGDFAIYTGQNKSGCLWRDPTTRKWQSTRLHDLAFETLDLVKF